MTEYSPNQIKQLTTLVDDMKVTLASVYDKSEALRCIDALREHVAEGVDVSNSHTAGLYEIITGC